MNEQSSVRGNGYAVSRDLNASLVETHRLRPLGRDTRKHPVSQIRKLEASLDRFGFVVPLVIDRTDRVIAGWGLVLAARKLGLAKLPAVVLSDLGEAELRSLRLALNRLGEDASWDSSALSLEFSEILDVDPSISLNITGFEMGEVDVILGGDGADEEDDVPERGGLPDCAVRSGELWAAGRHRILCGDALDTESYHRLLEGDEAQMVFADPPYNLRIAGHVSGLGAVHHDEFAMASGEMSPVEFQGFLRTSLSNAASHSREGAIHFVCMDWRHLDELLAAGKEIYAELKNICVWNKANAGMGSLYRSKHELVLVYKKGTAAHINNVGLGRHGRHRTNVWDYAGQRELGGARNKLALHPTIKPVALVADAMRDCSDRGGIVLDPFGGAGTSMIAAEGAGRRARLIEIDPRYVDVTLRRWQNLTGETPVRLATAAPLADIADEAPSRARSSRPNEVAAS